MPSQLNRKIHQEVWKLVRPRLSAIVLALLLLVLNRASNLALPVLSRPLIDSVIVQGNLLLLPKIIGIAVIAVIVQAGTSYALTVTMVRAGQEIVANLKKRLHSHSLHLPLSFFDHSKVGIVANQVMRDVEGLRILIGGSLLEMLGGLVTATLALIYLLTLNVTITCVLFGAIVAYGMILNRGFPLVHKVVASAANVTAAVTGRLVEGFGGIRTVKVHNAETNEENVFANGIDEILASSIVIAKRQSLLGLATSSLVGGIATTVMFLSAHETATGRFTAGGYVTYTLFLSLIIAPIGSLVSFGRQLSEAIAGLNRAGSLLDVVREDSESSGKEVLADLVGHVRFSDVTFQYSVGVEVLHQTSFSAAPGTITAIVGPSGAGKSTIMNLLCGFYPPKEGKILIDNKNISTLNLSSYRSHLGVVLQDPFLFDGTIRENVMLGVRSATDNEINFVCAEARVNDFAHKFPHGLDSLIGERGVKLSGGQRQRIALARALLVNPTILLLDEATSALDSENESIIHDNLNLFRQGRSTIIIAHRLSTIHEADEILFLEDGRIVEQGRHEDLITRNGRYCEYVNLQNFSKGPA